MRSSFLAGSFLQVPASDASAAWKLINYNMLTKFKENISMLPSNMNMVSVSANFNSLHQRFAVLTSEKLQVG
jgi:hypothetical protein